MERDSNPRLDDYQSSALPTELSCGDNRPESNQHLREHPGARTFEPRSPLRSAEHETAEQPAPAGISRARTHGQAKGRAYAAVSKTTQQVKREFFKRELRRCLNDTDDGEKKAELYVLTRSPATPLSVMPALGPGIHVLPTPEQPRSKSRGWSEFTSRQFFARCDALITPRTPSRISWRAGSRRGSC